MENKKYYWLKLKSDFFEDDTMQYIEEQPNGIYYSNFYLKLCLKSLKNDGKLIRLVGETLIPYDIKSLSKLTGVSFDIVKSAMELFLNIGLIQQLDSGELYLSQITELIGSETDKAQIMRRIRAEKSLGNNVTKVLPKCYTEIEKEIEKEKDIEIDKDICSNSSDFEREFDALWKLYPNKKGKTKAQSKYLSLRKKNKITYEQVENGIKDYLFYIKENKVEPQYIKNGSTWFNQECWNDDYSVIKRKSDDVIFQILEEGLDED